MASRQRWTLAAAILGSGIVFLDSTVVTVALPRIGAELPSARLGVLEAQSYVYNGYLLSLSALLILAGALTDFYGRRRIFTLGLVGFGLASVLCGLAPGVELLIAFRLLQGAAGAFLVPGSLAIITAAFAGEEQGRAFGIWAGASAVTTIIGPLVGGFLVDTVSWRAAFLLNVPLVLAAVWATRRHVVETTVEDARRFDWTGAAVVALAVGGLTFGLIRGQERQWADPLGWGSLAVGAAAAILFPLQQRRSAQPLVPAHLFRSRNFVVTNVSTVLIYGALYSLLYFLTIFLQGTRGYNAAAAGLATIPGLLLLAVFSSRFGKLSARFGPRWFMAAGPGLMAVGAGWLARMPDGVGPWTLEVGRGASWAPPPSYLADVLPGVLLFGAGAMIMVAPLTTALMTSVPTENSGIASAVNNAVSRVGPQLAGALIFVAVTASFYGNLVEAVPDLPVAAPSVRAELAPLNPPGPEVAPAVAAAARDASAAAFRLAMLAAAGLLVAGAAVNGVWIRNPGAAEPAREGTSVAGQMCVPAAEGSQARSAG